MERAACLHKNISCLWDDIMDSLSLHTLQINSVHRCVFFFFCGARTFSASWRAHSSFPVATELVPYKLKRSSECGGRLLKCLYPHIPPGPSYSCGSLICFKSLRKPAAATAKSRLSRGGARVWIKFQRGDGECVWPFVWRMVRACLLSSPGH